MRSKIIVASNVGVGELDAKVAQYGRMSCQLKDDVVSQNIDQVSLLINQQWSPIEMSLYGKLIKDMNRLGVIVEACVEGVVNLATVDMLLTGMASQKETLGESGDSRPGAVLLDREMSLTLERMADNWMPENAPSSLLYNALSLEGGLGGDCDAEVIHNIYTGEDFGVDVDILVMDRPASRLGGRESDIILASDDAWISAPLPFGAMSQVQQRAIAA